ncbi:hypothetical protein E3T61_04615 [Cryobacterium lactosi]|uniref:Uncharacterized protein n=1 Tax=Cryobacterium lactosi TaxID=1259202 RepID=A0A4R9BX29_9MICO|nr:hypothetical protein [Cryobacterium lactosi]TFD93380.1 hypothetical protein E3T61_04615 [Cryobacterium lactosi]
MSNNTQDEPVQDQNSTTENDKVAGILQQQEADLAGHDEAQVLAALRQRFADGGHEVADDVVAEHARRIAGMEPNRFSQE